MIQQLGRVMILLCALILVVACGPAEKLSTSKNGAFQVQVTLNPDPPKIGKNTATLVVKDKDGKAVTGAKIEVVPFMPMMGHGSTEEPKVKELGEGKYEASPITFQMAGKWELRVTIEAHDHADHEHPTKDTITFTYRL